MEKKFAYFEYTQSKNDIPVKFNIIRKSDKLLEWYIKKFNPVILKDTKIADVEGYCIRLPLLSEEEKTNAEKVKYIIEQTIDIVFNYDVDIILLPKYYPFSTSDNIYKADGKYIFALFIMEAINKILKIVKKDIKTAEILIINGNSQLTECIIDNIYPEINYLSLMTNDESIEFFREKAFDMFDDTGLNMQVFTKNKSISETADIIINTSDDDFKLDYFFKRHSVFFDLSSNKKKFDELVRKRNDMIIIDGLRLSYNDDEILSTQKLELPIFCLCDDYRSIVSRGYNKKKGENSINFIKNENIKLISFYQKNTLLSCEYFFKLLNKI